MGQKRYQPFFSYNGYFHKQLVFVRVKVWKSRRDFFVNVPVFGIPDGV
jgi:hypothetical protein